MINKNNIISSSEIIYYNNNEYIIKYNNFNNIFLYDFTLYNNKIIIEYNGNIWHANENLSEYEKKIWETTKYKITKIYETANTNIKYFNNKIKIAENLGFKVLVIWDTDSIENNLNKCINFINKYKFDE